jgi:hypothetical protein
MVCAETEAQPPAVGQHGTAAVVACWLLLTAKAGVLTAEFCGMEGGDECRVC